LAPPVNRLARRGEPGTRGTPDTGRIDNQQEEEHEVLSSLPVFYTPCMVADAGRFSPSPAKPRPVVESWRALGIPIEVIEPAPVTKAELQLAHDEKFVRGVLASEIPSGFGDRSPQVAASLPYTSGAMLAAARAARRNGAVAIAPCSGFHHAGYRSAGGFCTFNGLVVAAQAMKAAGEVRRVGILDFDQHYGDGTDDIIQRLGLDYIEHYSAGRGWGRPQEASRFLGAIPVIMALMADCDVILYQAGADPHVDDPLGGWLTTGELAERDLLVFEAARGMGVPLAWNLAGGYQSPLRKVLDIHDNTLGACWQVFGVARAETRIAAAGSGWACRS
jgi:acetoin utilization deacetylase AcuC-like enzyme